MDIPLVKPMLWAAPILLALLIFEIIYSRKKGHHDIYNRKDFISSISMFIGASILNPIAKLIYSVALLYFIYEIFNTEINDVRTNFMGHTSFGWVWYVWIIAQVLSDLSHYWLHRFNHTVRFMWAAHVAHHSSEYFNYGTAIRLSWVVLLYKPLFYAWLVVIGFHPEMIIACLGIEAVYQFVLHTSYCPKLGFLERILVTPKQHQVHHATNVKYLDKNHGAMLSIWDQIFGTYESFDEDLDIAYGVTHAPNSYNPIVIATHEYKAIWRDVKHSKTWRERFMYVFGAPGWHPNGETLTVKQMQKALKTTNIPKAA